MEKLILKNGQEFELVPMGIDTTEKRRFFKIKSSLTYPEIRTAFSNSVNIESIDYKLENGTISKTFLDCVALKGLEQKIGYKIDDTTTADIFIIELSTDVVERKLQATDIQIDDLSNTIVMISML